MKRARSTFKGLLTISRPTGGEREEITIAIEDESSRVEFIEASVSLTEFAKALTGHACCPIVFELRGVKFVGSKAENKTELVPFKPYDHFDERQKYRACDDSDERTSSVAAALKPFEVDGWKARISDMWNGHCSQGDFQKVTFFRYVRDGKPVEQ